MEHFVKIGIIGCGWIAGNAHLPAIMQEKRGKVIALYDSNIERARELGIKWKIDKTYDDLQAFWDSGVEAVIIASPNDTHVHYTIEALKRGIHVLCEKPVAFHASDIEKIKQVSKEHNTLYIPGFVNRWREDVQKLYQMIQEKRIGKIEKMEAGWLRKAGVPRPGTWFTNRELAGGGVLTDLGSHIVDICLLCLGNRKPVSYELTSSLCNGERIEKEGGASWFQREETQKLVMDVEDSVIAGIKFEDDVSLQIKLSWLAPVKADCTYFRVYGEEGTIELKTLFGFSNERLWEKDVLEVIKNGVKTRMILNEDKGSAKRAFESMTRYFIDSILTHRTEFTNMEDAMKTVSAIEKLYQVENRDLKREELLQEEF